MSDPIRPTAPHERSLSGLATRYAELLWAGGEKSVDEVLEMLAVRESIRRTVTNGAGLCVYEARKAGATWAQIATATGTDQPAVVAELEEWIAGQEFLFDWDAAHGRERPFGLSPEQRAAARALLAEDPA